MLYFKTHTKLYHNLKLPFSSNLRYHQHGMSTCIGSGNGLALNRRPVHRRIYATLGGDEFQAELQQKTVDFTRGHNPLLSSTDQSFHWTDKSSLQYEKWNLGEPAFSKEPTFGGGELIVDVDGVDDSGGCVRMYTGEHDSSYWDEYSCTNYSPFMCKVEQGITRPNLDNITR